MVIEGVAIADKPGRLSLYLPRGPFEDGTTHSGLPSLYASDVAVESSINEVEVTTLDLWQCERNLTRIDMIKMDIEGAELPALRGASDLIRRFRPSLIIELNAYTSHAAGYKMEDLLAWLEEHDYDVFNINDEGEIATLTPNRLEPFQNIFARTRS